MSDTSKLSISSRKSSKTDKPWAPCTAAYRSEKCPPLSDSESENEEQIASETIEAPQSQEIKPECFFVDQSVVNGTRTESIAKLEQSADQLKSQIDDINQEIERVHNEIREKKQRWLDAILKVVEFEKVIQNVENLMADKLYHFQSRIIELESRRMEIFKNSGDEKVRDLLEDEIGEVKEVFGHQAEVDEAGKDEMTQQGQTFAASLGDVVKEYQKFFDEAYESAKLSEPTTKVVSMKQEFDKNMALLMHLIRRPGKFCTDTCTGDRFFLNLDQEKVFKIESYSSEYKLNVDGSREKIKDGFSLHDNENGEFYVDPSGRKIFTKFYFEDEYGRFYIDIHGDRKYKADPEASEYMLVDGKWKKIKDGTYPVDDKGLRIKLKSDDGEIEGVEPTQSVDITEKQLNDDVNYIKETVGPAIRKALAAVALHQPADPINYFANFLLHYQYNQHMFKKRNNDLKHFLELRKEMKMNNDSEI